MACLVYLITLLIGLHHIYLTEFSPSVSMVGSVHKTENLHYGVPQGSVLGLILFTLYTQPLSDIISQSRCNHHKFADDTQLHKSSTPSDFHSMIVDVKQCIDSVWEMDEWQ